LSGASALSLSRCPPLQRRSQRAAAAALAAPTEAECGLAVDADVADEAARQRAACAAHLRRPSGGSHQLPAEAALPRGQGQAAAAGPDSTHGGADAAAAAAKEGDAEAAAAGGLECPVRPFAVQMWGLRKVYQVRLEASFGKF
jgi:hypothetical protein